MRPSWAVVPLTLCAGVGRVDDEVAVMELFMLENSSVPFGDNCEGLCGV